MFLYIIIFQKNIKLNPSIFTKNIKYNIFSFREVNEKYCYVMKNKDINKKFCKTLGDFIESVKDNKFIDTCIVYFIYILE